MLQLIRIQPSWICCHLHFSERPNKIKCDPIAANTRFWFFFFHQTPQKKSELLPKVANKSARLQLWLEPKLSGLTEHVELCLCIFLCLSHSLLSFANKSSCALANRLSRFIIRDHSKASMYLQKGQTGAEVSLGNGRGGFLCISSSELQDGVFICHDSWGCVDTKHTVNAASIPFNKLPRKKYEKNDSSWGHIDGYKILEALCSSHRLMDQYYCSYQKPSEPITPGRGAGARGGGGGAVTANYCQCFIYGRIHLISQQ